MDIGRTFREMRSRVRGGSNADAIHLERDELFDVLADSRRRLVIERLARNRDPPTCAQLAVEIAAAETHMPAEHVPRRRVEPVEDDLRAEHLPRLSEAGLLRWDGGGAEVRPGDSVEAVARLLADVDRRVRSGPTTTGADWRVEGPIEVRETPGSPRT